MISDMENERLMPVADHRVSHLWGVKQGLLDDAVAINMAVARIAAKLNLGLLERNSHKFNGHGVTSVAILSASHLVISTYSEASEGFYANIEAQTCRGINLSGLHSILKEIFRPKNIITAQFPLILPSSHWQTDCKLDMTISYQID